MGGTSTGMEIWNPNDGTVEMNVDIHPQERNYCPLYRSMLISINGILIQKTQSAYKLWSYFFCVWGGGGRGAVLIESQDYLMLKK